MDSADVGFYFTTDGEDIWRMITYCDDPTATMKNLETGETKGGSVYSLNLKPFVKLIPEKPFKPSPDWGRMTPKNKCYTHRRGEVSAEY